ncbi:hypothetical protein KGF56_003943 [Candida oxycetoniae]|uniref:Uncharacterized protein n=1 Tax=Candida oxycetoniae TaxID=497107 RepID=A0AAI9WX41_9ASCO|nr:uncharacterized protein KGF56_003943 [Candida oxycetoniae]KAI3403355.2 hypothetical protein KGF56_003943 [Candida oxycetoniae]
MAETYPIPFHVSLNTPIKKIQNLSINSSSPPPPPPPPALPPCRYSDMEDTLTSPTATTMYNKGYSHKLTNNVLSELSNRAEQISYELNPSPNIPDETAKRRNKRYTSLHSKYKQSDSISHHYSVHQPGKRRRTLNENNEIVAIAGEKSQVEERKEITRKISPTKISPSKISPSKASFNLHSLLVTETGSPNKLEVLNSNRNVPILQRKSSIPILQRKSSIPTLKPIPAPSGVSAVSIPQLQRKSSIPTLQRKSSIPTLQRKSSIPTLQKESLKDFSSHTSFPRNSSIQPPHLPLSPVCAAMRPPVKTTTTTTNLSRMSPSKSLSSMKQEKAQHSSRVHQNTIIKSKSITIPQPFSLYDKPTISSSQRSLETRRDYRDTLSRLPSRAR